MAHVHVFVQISLILGYFHVEICGGVYNGSQGRITRHSIRKKKVALFFSFCLSKTQEGTASFPITLELIVHMPLLLQIAPVSIC